MCHIAYFAARGLDEKGKATLRRVHGSVANYDVEVEYTIVRNTILEEQHLSDETGPNNISGVLRSYLDCFRGPNLRRTLGSTLPICAQQLTGLAFLNTYASLFFKQSGFTNAFLVTTIMGEQGSAPSLRSFQPPYSPTKQPYSHPLPRDRDGPHPSNRPVRPPARGLRRVHPLLPRAADRRRPRPGRPHETAAGLSHLRRLPLGARQQHP